MKDINNAPIAKIFDPSIYTNTISKENIPTYNFEGKTHINFKDMAHKVNDVNIKHVAQTNNLSTRVTEIKGNNYTVAYISIGTSNYGGYYILVDTRMPNCIFVLFRGTYSAKSAGSYSKPDSIIPFNIAKNISGPELQELLKENEGKMFGVLLGIDKILEDVYHSIIESMVYLSQTYLKATTPNSVKVYTTGHSLGGALTTLFASDWTQLTNVKPYNKEPYNIFTKQICCVSLAAPRVLSPALSNYFCQQTVNNTIIYRRVTNRGDPVPALPSKSLVGISEGYQHPCSTKKYASTQREVINLDCGSAQKGNTIDYDKPLNCKKTKTTMLQGNMSANGLAHTAYLYINFFNAVDLKDLFMSAIPSSMKKTTTEIVKSSEGDTVARIILGVANKIQTNVDMTFKSIFFKLNNIRLNNYDNKSIMKNMKGTVIRSDVLMNQKIFKELINNMQPTPISNINSKTSSNIFDITSNNNVVMPTITGINTTSATQRAGKSKKRRNITRKSKGKKYNKYKRI